MPPRPLRPIRDRAARIMGGVAAIVIFLGLVPIGATRAQGVEHLVISEIATGGAGANDEFIELFNPGTESLSLTGLELAYVSASGATASQRAAWPADAPDVPPGGHVLLANDAGVHAPGADVLYHGGLAEAGGTVILRWIGAATAIDAVAWGAAAGSWLEGRAAPAPPPGSSLERLTSDGRMQDTDDNATDFVLRAVPSPQAAAAVAPSASPAATPTPTPAATPGGTPTPAATVAGSAAPTASATALPGPIPISIAAARALADGTRVTVDGTALTGSAFGDGGGHLADGSGGIAVIVEGGSFPAGFRVVVTGTLDDRFAQRTIRAGPADILVLGMAAFPQPDPLPTGSVGEAVEGRLVRITATILGAPTPLSAGLAFEVDDGSGGARVVVGSATGIDASSWATGDGVELVGVVGQRDSSGSGTSGYRILPRSSADVLRVTPPESPTPSASTAPTASTTPTPSAAATDVPAAVTPIASARSAPTGTRLTLRGVVTLAPGVVDPQTAVIQDETAAIVLRVDDETGPIREGDLIEVDGLRSTKSGMETLRATSPARVQSSGAESAPMPVTAADVTERIEAQLVAVTGRLLASARRAASGTVSFDIEDATGVIRIVLPASLEADDTELLAGVEVEVIGVVGQETTAADPLVGYRIWPRAAADVRVLASPGEELESPPGPSRSSTAGPMAGAADPARVQPPSGALDAVETVGLEGLRIGATLVIAEWPGLGVGGLLWDGMRLVAVSAESATALAPLGARRPPIPLALSGLRAIGVEPRSGALLVALGDEAGDVALASGDPAPPGATLPSSGEPAAWVTLVGRLSARDGLAIEVGQATVSIDLLCGSSMPIPDGVVSVTGIGVGDPQRVIVPCDGIRAAPTLARTVVATEDPEATQATPTVDEADRGGVPSSSDRRRTLAGWLLGLAVLVVSGATLAWRRLAAPVDTERAEDREAPADEPHVPPLTLVRLRRDRSS